MKKSLLSLSLLLGLAGSVAAQNPCTLTLTKSGTGLTRTYTASLNTSGTPTYHISSYLPSGGGQAGYSNTNTLTVTYPGGGVYSVFAEGLSAGCSDSVFTYDTVAGPPAPTTNKLSVYVYTDSSATVLPAGYTPQVKTWLIKHDNTAGTLMAVDSVTTSMNVGYNYSKTVVFNAVPAGSYYTKSHIINQQAGAATSWLPTYSNNIAYWSNASTAVFTPNNTNTTLYKSNLLLTGTATSGPGFIGGLISAGANRGTAEGDPVAGITVFLRNATGKVLQAATTGANGKYSFSNLAAGTYTVYPEELGFSTTASDPIAIASAQSTEGKSYNFKRNTGVKEYIPGVVSLGVGTIAGTGFSVAPNPATTKIQITLGKGAGKVTATLSNITGQVVLQETLTESISELSVQQVPAGMYLLQLQNGTEIHTEKVQIQH